MHTPDHRCSECNKLLAKDSPGLPGVEIKCTRCGTLNHIFARSTEQVIVTDSEGIILYVNDATERMTGYTLAEVIGKRPSLWGGLMTKEFYESMWHTLKEKGQPVMVQVRNRRKDGTVYNALLRISPILDVNGEAKLFVGMETLVSEDEVASAGTQSASDVDYQTLQ